MTEDREMSKNNRPANPTRKEEYTADELKKIVKAIEEACEVGKRGLDLIKILNQNPVIVEKLQDQGQHSIMHYAIKCKTSNLILQEAEYSSD